MHEPKRTAIEALVVVVVGVTIALTANAMNSSGLKLGRDYFMDAVVVNPPSTQPANAADAANSNATNPATTEPATDLLAGLSDEVRTRLKEFSLTPIRQPQVKELFENPLYASDLYVIVDARDENKYVEGHIPGAHLLDYYQEAQYAPKVVPYTQTAEKVIVYCNGGDCDDSIHTARILRDQYVVDPAKIFVFPEGFEGWKTAGLPFEKGARNSGDISVADTAKGGAK